MRSISTMLSLVALLFCAQSAFAQNESVGDGGGQTESAINESASQDLLTSMTRKRPLFLGIVDTLGTPGDLSALSTTTTAGLMWNLRNGDQLGFGQDIESAINTHYTTPDGKQVAARGTETELGWTAIRYQLGPHKLLGSENIFAMFRYYAPIQGMNERWLQDPYYKHDLVGHQGILRADFEVPWMLSPHWTLAYDATPRANLVKQNDPNYDFGRSYIRYNHYAYAYYTMNDTLKFYGYYGYEHRWGANEGMHMYGMKALPGAGLIKDLNKTTFVQLEATHTMVLTNEDMSGKSSGLNGYDLRPENLGYEVTLFTLL